MNKNKDAIDPSNVPCLTINVECTDTSTPSDINNINTESFYQHLKRLYIACNAEKRGTETYNQNFK